MLWGFNQKAMKRHFLFNEIIIENIAFTQILRYLYSNLKETQLFSTLPWMRRRFLHTSVSTLCHHQFGTTPMSYPHIVHADAAPLPTVVTRALSQPRYPAVTPGGVQRLESELCWLNTCLNVYWVEGPVWYSLSVFLLSATLISCASRGAPHLTKTSEPYPAPLLQLSRMKHLQLDCW